VQGGIHDAQEQTPFPAAVPGGGGAVDPHLRAADLAGGPGSIGSRTGRWPSSKTVEAAEAFAFVGREKGVHNRLFSGATAEAPRRV